MTEGQVPSGTPEAWELDDLSRMRRIHEDLEREYLQIPEGRCRPPRETSVPSLGERSGEKTTSPSAPRFAFLPRSC